MDGLLVCPWSTVRCSAPGIVTLRQDQEEWVDLGESADAAFLVDVREVTAPAGTSVSLHLETAPSVDDALFAPVAPAVTLAASGAPLVTKSVRSLSTAPLARLLRWRLSVPNGTSGSWGATFRIRAVLGRSRFFVPTDLAENALWLRADLGVTLNGANVSSWADQSGSGRDATQATSSRQPAWNTSTINGQPTLFFDASSAGSEKLLLLGGSLASLSAGHVFLVHRRVSRTPASSARAGFWKLGSSAFASHVPFNDNLPYGNVYDDAGSTVRQTCGQAVFDMSAACCYEVRSAANAWSNHVNGIAQYSTATNTVGFASSAELGGNSVVATYYDGYVAEIVLFGRVLSEGERRMMVRYLNGRYALGMS